MALLPKLDTRTVLDVVEENFSKVGLKAYAERMVYTGEHTLPKEDIIQHFQASVNDVNSGYCEIAVRGLLLVYDSYFVHIIEGSEDTIHRHLRFLFNLETKWIEHMKQLDNEVETNDLEADIKVILEEESVKKVDKKMFRRLKLLIVYHSIKTFFFEDWRAVTARPPSLITKLDIYGSMADHMVQLKICLDKINRLCELARNTENLSFEGLSPVDPKMETLPEANLLDFLLQSQHVLDLRDIAHMHRRVDDYAFYFESVWPLPAHFTPKHLYKLKIDDSFVEPLPVMPWEIKKETGDDEEREDQERGSHSSESD